MLVDDKQMLRMSLRRIYPHLSPPLSHVCPWHLRPKVWSSKELDAIKRAAQFKMYDAVPSTAHSAAPSMSETDAEIEKFLPMLKDYLNGGSSCQRPSSYGLGSSLRLQ